MSSTPCDHCGRVLPVHRVWASNNRDLWSCDECSERPLFMKTCKSCRNILQSITKAGDYKIVESRCSIKLMDPVSGNEGEPECYLARTWPHHCGWEGRYWVAAKAKPLPGLGG